MRNSRSRPNLLCPLLVIAFGGISQAEWQTSEPCRVVLEVTGAGTVPGSIVTASLDFGALSDALGAGHEFSQYSLRVTALDGLRPGGTLPHRFDHAAYGADGSIGARGNLVFCVPDGGARRFAVYFGAAAPDPRQAPPPPVIGDGDRLRLRGTGTTSLAAPGLYPVVADYDSDGRRDLIGSDRYGTGARVVWWRNIGTDQEPVFSEHKVYPIQTADGRDISNPNRGWLLTVARCDWDADGTQDLLVGGWCRYLKFCRNVGSDSRPRFSAGVTIFDAKVFPGLDYGRNPDTPYQGVFIEPCDWDGDGRIDLLCGTYCRGHIYLLRNTDTGAKDLPVLDKPEPLIADGKEIDFLLHSKPSVADRDGDGDLDLMSGQYHVNGKTTGCYYFENTGSRHEPRLAAGVQLLDGAGEIIRPAYHMVTTMTDWDLDGRIDVLVSSYASTLLYLDKGRADAPKLTLTPIPCVGYEPCRVTGCFAYPVVVDWDADGIADIVTGDGEGTVQLFRGLGDLLYASPERIKCAGKPIDEWGCPDGGESQRGYVKVAVADWNADGFRDLIMWTENGEQGWRRGWREGSWCLKFFPGTTDPMDFAPAVEIQAAGTHIRAGYRCKPDVVDLDGDGLLDLVVACGPGNRRGAGTAMFFRNVGTKQRWELAQGTPLLLADGSSMPGPVRTALRFTDWDADGDLDLLTGNHSPTGARYWQNVGTPAKPVFAKPRKLEAVNRALESHHEVSVDAADLDGDESLDLVVGRGDTGTLHFFRRAFVESQLTATAVAAETRAGKRLEASDLRSAAAQARGLETRPVPHAEAALTEQTLLLLNFNGTRAAAKGGLPFSATAGEFAEGKWAKGLRFTGNASLAFASSEALVLAGGAIECWLKPDWNGGDDRNHYLFSVDDGFPNNLFWLLVGKRGELVLQASAGRVGKDPTMRLATVPLGWRKGEWHFVRCEWSGQRAALFVDGVLAAATDEPVIPPRIGPRIVIGNLFNGQWCLDGTLDDFHILRAPAE